VAVLGATGTVGQKLVRRLSDHPWFELTVVAASQRSAGRPYGEAVHWLEPCPIPPAAAAMAVCPVEEVAGVDLALSALDATTAAAAEPRLAAAGVAVVSNASALRMHEAVPLVVPEVNPDHLALVERQGFGRGFVVTNPNCATVGLVVTLKPLLDAFGLEAVEVTTMQAASGAGYPGVASLDLLGNAIPFIAGEEEKLSAEPAKILGRLDDGTIRPLPLPVSAQATRVPVLEGHLLSISVRLGRRADPEEVNAAFGAFSGAVRHLGLPSAPRQPILVLAGDSHPQPRLHAGAGGGMTVSVGRVRRCPVHDVRYVALVHNTERGAAGAALLNAELLVATGRIGQRTPLSTSQ